MVAMTYRPKGSLARTLYKKCLADEELRQLDKRLWYHVEMQYLPRCLQTSFVQLDLDEETQHFLDKSEEKSSWLITQVWHTLVKTFLGFFLTQTSINGLLHRGSMFVFSYQQFLTMTSLSNSSICIPVSSPSINNGSRRLLDLGAGDGAVTSVIDQLFDEVYVTEMSQPMKWILAGKGYTVLDVDSWAKQDLKFDVVLCLNLLDRCDCPLDILTQIRQVVQPGGIVVVALVLPFKPYVETGNSDHVPSQSMCISGQRFEDQVSSLVHNVLTPAGFSVKKWTRVPYLCEGDLAQAYYWLDDTLLILSPDPLPESSATC